MDLQRFTGGLTGGKHGFVDEGERLVEVRQHAFGRLGVDDLARLAKKQLRPDMLFQQLDLIADGGLGHPQFFAQAREKPRCRATASNTLSALRGTFLDNFMHKFSLWHQTGIPLEFQSPWPQSILNTDQKERVMSDHGRASRGRIARLCGILKACRVAVLARGRRIARSLSGRSPVPVDQLDERIRRDIGVEGRGWPDRRTMYYRTLLRRGQPLP